MNTTMKQTSREYLTKRLSLFCVMYNPQREGGVVGQGLAGQNHKVVNLV